jgi:CheY-like chemotaxis protein
MGYAHRSTALVVENDETQRTLVSLLLEESEMNVIECESAEAAVLVLEESGDSVSMVFTDVELAGMMDGIELAYLAKQRYPDMHVVVTSGAPRIRRLPDGTLFSSYHLHSRNLHNCEIADFVCDFACACASARFLQRLIDRSGAITKRGIGRALYDGLPSFLSTGL